jgi:hypothetical protein
MTEAHIPFEGTSEELTEAWQEHLVGHQAEGVTYDPKTGYGDGATSLSEGFEGVVDGHGEMGPGTRSLSPRDIVLGLRKATAETPEANAAVEGDDGTTSVVDGLTLDTIIHRADKLQ